MPPMTPNCRPNNTSHTDLPPLAPLGHIHANSVPYRMKRRIVVTGIGAIAPNGIGREAYWNATRQGISGVRRITRFDPECMQVQIAGEVTDFHEERGSRRKIGRTFHAPP